MVRRDEEVVEALLRQVRDTTRGMAWRVVRTSAAVRACACGSEEPTRAFPLTKGSRLSTISKFWPSRLLKYSSILNLIMPSGWSVVL